MFNKIQNPETGKWVNIHGSVGKRVLRNYVKVGGSNTDLDRVLAESAAAADVDLVYQYMTHEEAEKVAIDAEIAEFENDLDTERDGLELKLSVCESELVRQEILIEDYEDNIGKLQEANYRLSCANNEMRNQLNRAAVNLRNRSAPITYKR